MKTRPLNYLSLGDSIATGFIDPFRSCVPFPYLLQPMLSRLENRPVRLFSLARNGITSGQLHELTANYAPLRHRIRQADLITLSVGGNDLLQAATVPGFAHVSAQAAEHGLENFARFFPETVGRLRLLNPRAFIIGMTIYNPYGRQENGLRQLTEQFLGRANRIILDQLPAADIHRLFLPLQGVVCMYPKGLLRNPHPTPRGQRLIARGIFAEYCRQKENRV